MAAFPGNYLFAYNGVPFTGTAGKAAGLGSLEIGQGDTHRPGVQLRSLVLTE